MKLRYFEDLKPDALQDYYSTDIDFEGRQIQLDINFESSTITESRLLIVNNILEKLPEFVDKLKHFIQEDFKEGNDVQEFLDFHIEEMGEELDSLLSTADKKLSRDEQLLSVVSLRRIGFYPEEDDNFTVADFGLDPEVSQYVLVVNTTEDQELSYITMES